MSVCKWYQWYWYRFFFRFLENKETGEHIPVVITNKHVVSGSVKGRLIFCLRKADSYSDPGTQENGEGL